MIALGIGCRSGATAEAIVTLAREALALLPENRPVSGLYTIADKRGEPGLEAAARELGLTLVFLDREVLVLVSGEARSCSRRVEEMFGLPGIAETAALAGAGQGATLLVGRIASEAVTCAIAGPPGAAG